MLIPLRDLITEKIGHYAGRTGFDHLSSLFTIRRLSITVRRTRLFIATKMRWRRCGP